MTSEPELAEETETQLFSFCHRHGLRNVFLTSSHLNRPAFRIYPVNLTNTDQLISAVQTIARTLHLAPQLFT